MSQEQILRRSIVEVGKLLYERKLVSATDGNISTRLDRKQILITPSGFCKGFMSETDVIRVPLDMRASNQLHSPGPSSETAMHIAVYLARSDISAIVHAHPPYATSFAVSGKKLDHNLLPETRIFDGAVGRVPYLEPGTMRLAQTVGGVIKRHNLALLGRHGAITIGNDLLSAYYRMERLEFLAQVAFLSARLK